MSKELLKTHVASKDWVSLEIERSTKNFVTHDQMDKHVDLKLKPYVEWKWALGAILTLIGIFFGGVWAILNNI